MQQTETYKLNLIETGDTFSPQPINENMEAIEEKFVQQEQEIEKAALSGLKIATGSYVGDGTYGAENMNTFAVDFKPQAIFVWCLNALYRVIGIQGKNVARYYNSNDTSPTEVVTVWGENSISFYTTNAFGQLNQENHKYQYIILGE